MIWVVYVKSSEIETAYAFVNEIEAIHCANSWGKYAIIIPVKKPEIIMRED